MGNDQSTLCVWRMPDDAYLPDLDRDEWPSVFLQAAGSAEAMTIEWRRVDDDGEERLYVLGHGGPRDEEPSTPIHMNDGENVILVHPDEVFDATEAGEIFFEYLKTERVPDTYALRPFDIEAAREELRRDTD